MPDIDSNADEKKIIIMQITVNKIRRPKNKTEECEAGKFLNDKEQSDWETGKLGRDEKHMKPTNITLSGKPKFSRSDSQKN